LRAWEVVSAFWFLEDKRMSSIKEQRSLLDSAREASIWVWLALASLACLTAVDMIRDYTAFGRLLVIGVAPNFFGFFALIFAWMAVRFPKKNKEYSERPSALFLRGWVIVALGPVAWEFVQLRGSLVFDVYDIWATVIGAVAAAFVYSLVTRLGL